ncbi:MAG: response regulator [Legionellales bacterium]|nr:response regulator [Legionellales bacterium]
MTFDPEFMKQLAETFRVELDEKLQIITDGLLALEKNNLSETDMINTVDAIFRAAHNIKGSAYGVGIDDIGKIAHIIESLFSAAKNHSVKLDTSHINLSLEAIDKMRLAMKSFLSHSTLPFSLDDLLSRLENACLPEQNPKKTKRTVKKTASVKTKAPPAPTQVISSPEPSPTPIVEKAATKSSSKLESEKIIHVSLNNLDRISALMEKMQVTKIAIEDQYQDFNKLTEKIRQIGQLWDRYRPSFVKSTNHEPGEIISRFYEMGDNALHEIADLSYQLNKNMRIQVNELSLASNSLQEEIRMLRLIPANTLMKNMPRYVRDLAMELGREVDFKITGDEVKLDKIILEGLQDPLTHLLRNSIDHGIETSDIRVKKGKSATGHINVDIREEGDHILFKIEDDGTGIDVKKIAQHALDSNFISKAELAAMDEKSILNLIFRPGFSTKEDITAISGRGVGLDIVKTNIENLKGQVDVTTEKGVKSAFLLRVPLTLASEQGLLIHCAGQEFVLPTNSIERVLITDRKDIMEVEASQAILLDKHPIHLMMLADILQIQKHEPLPLAELPIIVIKKGALVVALVVDGIIGDREIVVKPLQAPLFGVPCVSGGTLSGSGKVIVVLNSEDIVNRAFHIVNSTRIVSKDTGKNEQKIRPHILVVDDSITTRTLEKNVLESKDYQVSVAADGKQAWEMLQKQAFALLISDIMMPEMDGLTLTKHIRKSDKLHDLPIILVTSLGTEEEKMQGLEAGANYYIIKNEFESGALLEIVEQLI